MASTLRHTRWRRSGAVAVESAVVLMVALLILLGMLELSLVLIRHTAVAEAARRVARAAMVHGAKAKPPPWGPTTLTLSAAGPHAAAQSARSILPTLPPEAVSVRLEWPDGGNQPDQRIRVTVHYAHHPVIPIPGWYEKLDLRGVSTMYIAH